MTNHPELVAALASLRDAISEDPPIREDSFRKLASNVLRLVPPHSTVRASSSSDSELAYAKALRELEESVEKCKSFTGTYSYLRNELHCIQTGASFSTQGVRFDPRLQQILLEQLKGSRRDADLQPFDDREIIFHKQVLLDADLATGNWSGNGRYIYEVNLKALTPRGWDLVNAGGDGARQVQKSILFVSSDPRGVPRLRLLHEEREIRLVHRSSRNRDRFKFETCPSARPKDITDALLQMKPTILHFSGHGTIAGKLCFENDSGELKLVSCKAIASLLRAVDHPVEFVVLNCCYSAKEAADLSDCVSGIACMSDTVSDDVAISFATGFYQAVFALESNEDAFAVGKSLVMMEIEGREDVLSLVPGAVSGPQ
jgi:CHAT domain